MASGCRKAWVTACAGILSLYATTAAAVPLNYDERIDGDIAPLADGLSLRDFALGFGVNSVAGTVSCAPVCEFDKFNAVLPDGGVLEGIGLTLTLGEGGDGDSALVFDLLGPLNERLFTRDLAGPGEYYWDVYFAEPLLRYVGLNAFLGGMVNDYRITLSVGRRAEVPEPGTLLLLGAGLAGLGFARRRAGQPAARSARNRCSP